MTDLARWQKLKAQINAAERRQAEAAGALKQIESTIREEFGERAVGQDRITKLLKQLEQKAEKAEQEADKAQQEFEKKWGEKLRE